MKLDVAVGDPGTVPDEADVAFTVQASDVRLRTAGLPDYTGELDGRLGLRLTDKQSGSPATDSATVQDLTLRFSVACTATGGTEGADCAVSTSADALAAGTVVEGKRAIWQLDQVRVFDGGPDGDADTQTGNTLFAVQGLFVP